MSVATTWPARRLCAQLIYHFFVSPKPLCRTHTRTHRQSFLWRVRDSRRNVYSSCLHSFRLYYLVWYPTVTTAIIDGQFKLAGGFACRLCIDRNVIPIGVFVELTLHFHFSLYSLDFKQCFQLNVLKQRSNHIASRGVCYEKCVFLCRVIKFVGSGIGAKLWLHNQMCHLMTAFFVELCCHKRVKLAVQ